MPILAGDIKFVKSTVMDDVPEGGGAPTGNVVADGVSNEIFSDISELDRAGGNVSLRKIFVSVETDNTDTYLDSNIIIAEPPTDPNVSVTLFSTSATFDTRDDARQRVEAYLTESSELAGYLLENHISGQRVIQIFQRPSQPLPNIGETLVMILNEGLSTERKQYVRAIDTSSVLRTYTEINSNPPRTYEALVVSVSISDPLRFDFPGSVPSVYFSRNTAGTKIRETSVADAAIYCGVATTVDDIAIGDLTARVDSVFTQLVPSAQTEIPLIEVNAAGTSAALTPSGDSRVSYTTSSVISASTALSLGNPVNPGTLTIVIGATTLSDTGGQIFDGATAVGVIDYARGIITFPPLSAPYSGTKIISYQVAAAPLRVADTLQIKVTVESRAFNYVLSILPAPAPGTVLVSYRAQGRWYDLRDTGGGVLRGSDSAYGVGSINYATGAVALTLGVLPDVGSSILFGFGTQVNYIDRADISVENSVLSHILASIPIVPDTLTIAWNDGTARTASDDGKGVLSGSATGTVDYETGEIKLNLTTLPAPGLEFSYTYNEVGPTAIKTELFANPIRNGDLSITIDLGQTNVIPGTIKISYDVDQPTIGVDGGQNEYRIAVAPRANAYDDGDGNIICELSRQAGTVNYETGIVVFHPDGGMLGRQSVYRRDFTGGYLDWIEGSWKLLFVAYITTTVSMAIAGGNLIAKFQTGESGTGRNETGVAAGAISFDLTNRFGESIIPGSVNFTFGGKQYFDRLGSVYTDLDVVTGAATLSGTLNYSTGKVSLSAWTGGTPNTVTLTSLVTTAGDNTVSGVTFRIPVSPVRPGSLQIIATKATGGSINVTANIDGTITGAGVRGFVGYETGVVGLEFGAMVTAAGNEGQAWYRAENVVGGQIWKPEMVFAETLRFNAVAYSYLPLDSNILGLDPVRLPQDGRVPIFRKGGFSVLGHSKTTSPATVSNGQTINLARVRLSRVRVIGSDGVTINAGYSTDLEAGTVTFTNVTGYSQPVRIEDRVEDLVQVSDVQISGQLAFTRPLTHAYPAGSHVSSALIAGDLKARVSHLYDQTTWDRVTWQDTLIGSGAVASFNATLSPVEVANFGAVSERWALQFTSTTAFQIIGEHVGVIGTSSINVDTLPLNPATGTPYFTMRALGWGTGWAIGNTVRLNTVGAQFPIWAVRTVQQGAETVLDDTFELLIRGDVDRP